MRKVIRVSFFIVPFMHCERSIEQLVYAKHRSNDILTSTKLCK